MKKILFLIPNLGHGGAEKVLVNLVNYMDKTKFEITVMSLYDEGVNKKFLSKKIRYMSCFKKSFKGVSQILKLCSPTFLYSWLIKDKYDIVVSYLEGQTARICSGCTEAETKLVCWIHVEQHTAQNAARCFRNIEEMKRCYSKFDRIVCVSEYVRDDFCSIIPVKHSTVLYNTVESEKIQRLSNQKIKEEIFNSNEIKLCSVGTLKKSKGFDRLLRVHKRLLEECYPIHTYILGEGEQRKMLENYVKCEDLSETVTFLGYQINPYKYMKQCDLFVCTSYAEGYSTAATEALIIGIPVCTMEVSGMKEMLGTNNEYGVITPNNEEDFYVAIKRLISDKNLLQHYRKQAEFRGKMFNTENTVTDVENFFLGLF